jgi:putative addiction module killer protein
MLTVIETGAFSNWLAALKDVRGRAKIAARIERIRLVGHFGDSVTVGEGVNELRVHFGPGYRDYFSRRGAEIVLLLGGGDKGSQARDIRAAQTLAKES